MSLKTVTVSRLTHYLKQKIDNDQMIQKILVEGEISNFTRHRSGHLYFTLKDEKARISCVMFASNVSKLKFNPKNGDGVIVACNTSVFEATGSLQIYVTNMQLMGIGDLYYQFEMLKRKLDALGLFNIEHKKAIVKYPTKIGIITGRNTAAYNDIISTLNARWPIAELFIYPVLVQGEGSANQIIKALKYVDSLNFDTIILARGGGSIEDLWSFNNEDLAYCIYNLKTPIITGVGHEIDTTIVDYVSDLRAPTPTGAAVLASPDINEVRLQIQRSKQVLNELIFNLIKLNKDKLNDYKNLALFNDPNYYIYNHILKLDYLHKQLLSNLSNFKKYRYYLNENKLALNHIVKSTIIKQYNYNEIYRMKLISLMVNKLKESKQLLSNKISLMDAYSPLKILNRGYSITSINDKVISNIDDIQVGSLISTKLANGTIISVVKEKNNG